MPLPPVLPIAPFTRPVRGSITLPGSKSLTNRALLLAALCDHPVVLENALFSEDTAIMADALNALGIPVAADPSACTMRVQGRPGGPAAASSDLYTGLAGTAARFLTALCAAAPGGVHRLDGTPRMRTRPMKGLIDALRSLGADIRCNGQEGFFPLEIHARGLRGGAVSIDAGESSQMLSALLMAAPLAREPVEIRLSAPVRAPFVEMTINLMHHFGVEAVQMRDTPVIRVPAPQRCFLNAPADPATNTRTCPIEPDATAASYFLALPLVAGGEVHIPRLAPESSLQGDMAFAGVLARAGMRIGIEGAGLVASFAGGPGRGLAQDFSGFSDTFLTLAAIAPLLDGPTRITGIAHTRKQETDRVAGMAAELRRLGQHVIETDDSLEIHPRPLHAGVEVGTHGDHRFAMSFAILGCHDLNGDGTPWLSIADPSCCAKTFPGFFDLLDAVRTAPPSHP